jgi:uncharacterized protein YeaO (DUF488 family)
VSSDTRRPIVEARAIAESLVALLSVGCDEIMIAGSIRRGKEMVGDVEIVALATPKLHGLMDRLLLDGVIEKAIYPDGNYRWGKLYRGIQYMGMKCEVFLYDSHNRGYQQILRTGPGDANTTLMTLLSHRRAPYRFQDGYCWYSLNWYKNHRDEWAAEDRKLVPCPDEQTVFKLLGLPFIEPHERTEVRYQRLFGRDTHVFGSLPHICEICTGRINVKDPDALDVTAKSASTEEGKVLSPPWSLVNELKSGAIDWNTYCHHYLQQLRVRYSADPNPFMNILRRDRVVLTCYCSHVEDTQQCHRYLARDVLKKIAASKGLLVFDGGELKPQPKQISMF